MSFDEIQLRPIGCPYCGEQIEVLVDASAGSQQYIEDCQVCCRPIEIQLVIDPYGITLIPKRDDE